MALEPTRMSPSSTKRTSLAAVTPKRPWNGPSAPMNGVAAAMLVPTVTAQKASWSHGSR